MNSEGLKSALDLERLQLLILNVDIHALVQLIAFDDVALLHQA